MNKNHINGYIKCKYNYGLIKDDEIISLISINDNIIYRFCDKLNYNISNSLKILTEYFCHINKINNIDIILDRSYFYIMEGFDIISKSESNIRPNNNFIIYDSGEIRLSYINIS